MTDTHLQEDDACFVINARKTKHSYIFRLSVRWTGHVHDTTITFSSRSVQR